MKNSFPLWPPQYKGSQVKEAYVGKPGEGSGLGLSLVNSLIDLHGGMLDIDSTPGEGTKMSITFPRERTLTAG